MTAVICKHTLVAPLCHLNSPRYFLIRKIFVLDVVQRVKFETSFDLNKCLKQIKLPGFFHACTPISELSSNISTMVISDSTAFFGLTTLICRLLLLVRGHRFNCRRERSDRHTAADREGPNTSHTGKPGRLRDYAQISQIFG